MDVMSLAVTTNPALQLIAAFNLLIAFLVALSSKGAYEKNKRDGWLMLGLATVVAGCGALFMLS